MNEKRKWLKITYLKSEVLWVGEGTVMLHLRQVLKTRFFPHVQTFLLNRIM